MDRTNFLATDDFPAASDDLDRLQQATLMVAKLALLGGSNYILSGCVTDGANVTPGMIVIAGEILPFQGGEKKDKVTIQETKITLEAFDTEYPEAYINRIAVFADEGPYNWNDIKQVLSNKELETKISEIRGEPPGMKIEWTGRIDRIPENYMLADGRILKTIDYPDLAWFYGSENDESFALPDLKHQFIVGYDSTKSDYNAIGKTGGLETVTLSTNEIPSHNHVKNQLFNKLSAKAGDIDEQSTPGSIDQANAAREYNVGSMTEDRWIDATIQNVGGGQSHENRPPFYVLAFLIKVKY